MSGSHSHLKPSSEAVDGGSASSAGNGRFTRIVIAVLIGLYALFAYSLATHTHRGVGPGGAPLFYDFCAFYQAGSLADSGRAAAAYDDATMVAAERAAFPGMTTRLPWNYPPAFQLLMTPFAALPYVAAWLAWSCATYGLYVLVARQLAPTTHLWLFALAPGAAVNLFVGQNGVLSTALIGAGALFVTSRPIFAGALLGLMIYKPQLAILAPLALLGARQWRALAGFAISASALVLLSVVVLGLDPWVAFLHKAAQPAAVFTSSSSDWRAIPSVMILARSLSLGAGASAVLHWSVAATATAGAIWVWRNSVDPRFRAGALAAATLLVSPYLRAYDLALLILPVAALLPIEGAKVTFGERAIIFAAWAVPAALTFAPPRFQYGALVSIAILGAIVLRTARANRPAWAVSAA